MVGLSNVNNTTDALKPISTATLNALALLAPLASPTFTGTINCFNLAISGTPSGTGIATLLASYYTKIAADNQFATKTDVTNLQLIATVATGTNPIYYLNVRKSGLYIRSGVNNLLQVATDGTVTASGSMNIAGSAYISGSCNCTYGVVANNVAVGGAIATTAVSVTGAGVFSRDLTAKSIKLMGPQSPIIYALDVAAYSYLNGTLTVAGDAGISGKIAASTVNVSSCVTMPGYTFCSGLVSAAGVKTTSTGQVSYTSSRTSTGLYVITLGSPHPLGANYIVHVTAQGCMSTVRNAVLPTSTSFQVVTYTLGTVTSFDNVFSFMVLAS